MLKRSFAILSIVLGMVLFLLGCSKANHDTLAFVGDESGMKTCYQIYPEQYFPSEISQELTEGRFPPDLVGEYEMYGSFVDGYYEYYNQMTHQYVPVMPQAYPTHKTMYLIVEEQVNAMAKIKIAFKKNNYYKDWYECDAYVYGNVYSENKKDFLICFENSEEAGVVTYYRGNIIKGTIEEDGIKNIDTWSVIKGRVFENLFYGLYNEGGYEHYHADLAERKAK